MRWILFFVLVIFVEFYSYQAIRTLFKQKWVIKLYTLISIFVLFYILITFYNFDQSIGQNNQFLTATGLLLLVYLPKFVVSLFLFGEDLVRVIGTLGKYLFGKSGKRNHMPSRRNFISTMALGVASLPFGSVLYGIIQGRYNYKVLTHTLFFDDLPDDFDGFKIMQLSDIHCGSFVDAEKIKYGIDLINEQNFDVLLFTGDMVNNFAYEMDPWLETFSSIKNPKFGKYAVLGNHDYGDYSEWEKDSDRAKNLEEIKEIFPKIGFNLLLNQNAILKKGNSELKIIGVENWGKGRFQKYGDLVKASEGIQNHDFKILLSHDPSHWEMEVRENELNYQLTLSGHTHGMQFGIEIPGWIKWSPVSYVYKYWAGMYQENKRYLHVNRGFGYHAYPGRVGIWPEITLIELRKKQNV